MSGAASEPGLTVNIKGFSLTLVCYYKVKNNVIVGNKSIRFRSNMLQCQPHIFCAFVSSQIPDDWSRRVVFAQMMSCVVLYVIYDIIYHPLSILNI